MDLVGCHRRSTYPDKEDFRCSYEEGVVKGPPCTAKKGDTFKLHVHFDNLRVRNLTQVTFLYIEVISYNNLKYAWWEISRWVPDAPWVGMDSEGCPYLDGGTGCETPVNNSKLLMDIHVNSLYPSGNNTLTCHYLRAMNSFRIF